MNALELTRLAYKNNEIDKLLLGDEPYIFMDRFVPAPRGIKTNLADLVPAGLYEYKLENPNMETELKQALHLIANTPLGIWTLACFIMLDSDTRITEGKSPLDLSLNELAAYLKSQILKHKEMLANEKTTLNGNHHANGVLGELERLANITKEDNGPDFFPPELSSKQSVAWYPDRPIKGSKGH